jgi:hypothetical protein
MFFDVTNFENPFKKQTTIIKKYDYPSPNFDALYF